MTGNFLADKKCCINILHNNNNNNNKKIPKQRWQTKRKQDWKNKRLHGQFRDTEDIVYIKSWNWLRNSHLKKET